MGALIERWYPPFLGVLTSIIYYIFFRKFPLSIRVKDLLMATVNISAIAVGFLAAAKSILLTIQGRKVIRQAKTAGLYQMLIDYMIWAIYSCFFLSIFSAIGLLLDLEHQQNWYHYAFAIWLFISINSLFSFCKVIRLLGRILLLEDIH